MKTPFFVAGCNFFSLFHVLKILFCFRPGSLHWCRKIRFPENLYAADLKKRKNYFLCIFVWSSRTNSPLRIKVSPVGAIAISAICLQQCFICCYAELAFETLFFIHMNSLKEQMGKCLQKLQYIHHMGVFLCELYLFFSSPRIWDPNEKKNLF